MRTTSLSPSSILIGCFIISGRRRTTLERLFPVPRVVPLLSLSRLHLFARRSAKDFRDALYCLLLLRIFLSPRLIKLIEGIGFHGVGCRMTARRNLANALLPRLCVCALRFISPFKRTFRHLRLMNGERDYTCYRIQNECFCVFNSKELRALVASYLFLRLT